MTMGEKAADLILGKAPLPPSKQPFYTAANCQQASAELAAYGGFQWLPAMTS